MNRTVVLDVVGLTRALLGEHTPRLNALRAASANLGAITPAVTCSAQSTYLTGKLPSGHGIVGNGWYYRDVDEVALWKQSNRLVQGEKIWQQGKRRDPAFSDSQRPSGHRHAHAGNNRFAERRRTAAIGRKA